jgi:hypothetical protein
MGAAHPLPLCDEISVLQTTVFTAGHHQNYGVAADRKPGMIIQLSADDSRDTWTWFAGDLSAWDASARLRPAAPPRTRRRLFPRDD